MIEGIGHTQLRGNIEYIIHIMRTLTFLSKNFNFFFQVSLGLGSLLAMTVLLGR